MNVAKLVLGVGLACSISANAASVSYYLDQSNIASYPDGTNYLQVTISDGAAGAIDFTVTTLVPALPSTAKMDQFGFNPASSLTLSAANVIGLPIGWSLLGAGNMDGFGGFSVRPDTNGNTTRVSTLTFSIVGISGDTPTSYVNLSTGTAGQGNTFFAAHLAGLTNDPNVTSGYFGGSTPVPVPAAAWLFGSGLVGLSGIARRKAK